MKRLSAGWIPLLLVAAASGMALASHAQEAQTPATDGPEALMAAARLGRVETVRRLLEVGLDPDAADEPWESHWGGRFTAVTWAVSGGHRDVLEVLLKAGASGDANGFSPSGQVTTTVLHLAAYYRRPDLARLLLDHGARVNGRGGSTERNRNFRVGEFDEQGGYTVRDPVPEDYERDPTPLHVAAAVGALDCIHMLIEAGADLESRHSRATPLLLAAMCEQEEAAEALLHARAELDLYSAIALDKLEATQELLEGDAALLGSRDVRLHRTPLHWAARFGRTRIIEHLLPLGADVHAVAPAVFDFGVPWDIQTTREWSRCEEEDLSFGPSRFGEEACTPLHLAVRNGHFGATIALLRAGVDLNARDSEDDTPLELAIESGHRDLALWLLERGADPNLPADGDRALHAAVYENDPVLVRRLIEAGAELEYHGSLGETPLELAGLWGSVEAAEVLRAAGGKIDFLTACVLDDRVAVRKWLLEQPSLVESFLGRFQKWRAVEIAAARGHLELLQELIARGARLEPAKEQQTTVLHEAARNGQLRVLRWLLERDLDRDELFAGKWASPLDCAAEGGRVDAARHLLERGAEIDSGHSRGTALHAAVEAGEVEMVRLLLDCGAETLARDGIQRTPLHLAATRGDPVIARLLLDAGADARARDRDGWTPLNEARRPVGASSRYPNRPSIEDRRAVVEILLEHAERR